ncbi:BglG family transcription antiterminator [Bacillus sp. KH172YL63]|uniref:BglG family transcription antiterminator n=1 Tax=Bacillus sp. KH172YL63 TaxID=2709784 RepID=UPI0013E479A4|nr:PRD domain-containing protein [Bacillus sp. KH172YL63]BCB02594.1 transcriptional regulator MtlR [Bacillus sp. KH172YL63]
MFITSREKAIIELIVKTSGKHTVYSLSAFLNVSGRTIQRNLKSIESMLKEYHLELKRTANEGLFIDGKNEHIYRLIQHLAEANPTDETPEERKLNLLITLLHEGPSFKKQVLANQLGTSVTTLSAYLDELADWLGKFGITLTRKRGVGVELFADEGEKRHALASFFLVYFYEEIIETLYGMQKGNRQSEPVLGYFNPDYLVKADQVVSDRLAEEQITLTDSDYIGLIVHICLTIQRTETGYGLQGYESDEDSNEHRLMDRVCSELEQSLNVHIPDPDRQFLTVILKGSKVQEPDVVYYDSILLGHLIKNLIRDVSEDLHVDLSDDFSLFQGLLAHMGPSIFRLQQELELFNPLTDEIRKKYPVLFLAVKKSLEKEFKDITFPDDEVAFIVLHFGSAMLMNEEKVNIHAVVVCPTGIGTSKMLASRIQRELTMINRVEILSIKDFQTADLLDYDIVISTVRLPFTEVEYILVSPLLSEKDIGFIQSYLQNNVEKLTRKKYLRPAQRSNGSTGTGVRTLLQEIKDVHSSMEAILSNFRVYRKGCGDGHVSILGEMVEQAEKDGLLEHPEGVVKHLLEREKKGGLGIPNTPMGLFHCRDVNVKKLIFQVAHLDEPCRIKGMDGGEMEMKSLLLMLAPEELSRREQEILSLISTSLIEDQISMMIYSSTNEAIIVKKLEELFMDYLQTNLIKE